MSAKIISDDAKRFMEDQVHRLREWVKAMEANPWSSDQNTRDIYKTVIGKIEMALESDEAWKKTEPIEASIITPSSDAAHTIIFGWRGLPGKAKETRITGTIILCHNALFEVRGFYSEEEAKLLVQNKVKKMRGEVDYLKFRKDIKDDLNYDRLPIPEDVKNDVWRRDQGKCVRCGSVYKLEFDHIIPVTKGGSNTARNIQLLCEPCNRQKSNNIG